MELRSGRKIPEVSVVLGGEGREAAVPSRSSAGAIRGLERPLLAHGSRRNAARLGENPAGSSSSHFKFSWKIMFHLGCGKAERYTVKANLTACTSVSASLFLDLCSPALGLVRQPV